MLKSWESGRVFESWKPRSVPFQGGLSAALRDRDPPALLTGIPDRVLYDALLLLSRYVRHDDEILQLDLLYQQGQLLLEGIHVPSMHFLRRDASTLSRPDHSENGVVKAVSGLYDS